MLIICSPYTRLKQCDKFVYKEKSLESWCVFSVLLWWIENIVNSLNRPVSIANTTLNERDVHETTEASTSRYLKVAASDKCESKLVLYTTSPLAAATLAVPLWQESEESHHVVDAETVADVSTAGSARPLPPSSDQISVWSHPWSWYNCRNRPSTQPRFRYRIKLTFNIT